MKSLKSKRNNKINICGVFVDNYTFAETILVIEKFLKEKKFHQIVPVNSEIIVDSQNDKEFLEVINNADLVTADGAGVLWAASYLKKPLFNFPILKQIQAIFQAVFSLFFALLFPKTLKRVIKERVSGSDLIWDICRLASEGGWSVFFLGGGQGVAQQTAEKIKEKYPNLKVAGTYPGSPKETEKILQMVNQSKADILFVAWGAPKQDKWIAQNIKNFKTVKVAMGVGGSFDFIVGQTKYYDGRVEKVKRAPLFLRKMGLEWFWRFLSQPWRFRRVIKAVPVFIFQVIRFKIKKSRNGKS